MPASQKLAVSTDNRLARRVAKYLNRFFDGNLSEAARVLGCPYDALRETALGHAVRPNFAVFQKLAAHAREHDKTASARVTLEEWLG